MAAQISDKFAGNGLATVVTDTKSEGILRPTTSNDTGRYDRTGFAVPLHMKISSGMFIGTRLPEPAYLPPNWSAHVHPEGQIYFSRRGSPRVVTEAYLYRPETLDKVTHWIKKIEDIAASKNFPMSEHLELFIDVEGEGCAHYFVDHNIRAQWMDDINTDARPETLDKVTSGKSDHGEAKQSLRQGKRDNASKSAALKTPRNIMTEALKALNNVPGVAILRSIIYPLLDVIDRMQHLGALHHDGQSNGSGAGARGNNGEGSKIEINVNGSGHTLNISGGTGGSGGPGKFGGQGGTGKGPVITVQDYRPRS